MFMEKYQKSDNIKVKELNLEIEKLNTDKNIIENKLSKKMTDT